jgi:hypothetical protein
MSSRDGGRAPTIATALPEGAAARKRGLLDTSLINCSGSVSSFAISLSFPIVVGRVGAASVSVGAVVAMTQATYPKFGTGGASQICEATLNARNWRNKTIFWRLIARMLASLALFDALFEIFLD